MNMPFGKHKGQDMENVPASYLLWLSEQDWISQWPDVKGYIDKNMAGIKKQIEDGNGNI